MNPAPTDAPLMPAAYETAWEYALILALLALSVLVVLVFRLWFRR